MLKSFTSMVITNITFYFFSQVTLRGVLLFTKNPYLFIAFFIIILILNYKFLLWNDKNLSDSKIN